MDGETSRRPERTPRRRRQIHRKKVGNGSGEVEDGPRGIQRRIQRRRRLETTSLCDESGAGRPIEDVDANSDETDVDPDCDEIDADDAEKDIYGHESIQTVAGCRRDAARNEEDESVDVGEWKMTEIQTVVGTASREKRGEDALGTCGVACGDPRRRRQPARVAEKGR